MDHFEQKGISDHWNFTNFFKNRVNVLVLAVSVVGLLLLSIGASLFLFGQKKSEDDIKIITSVDSSPGSSQIVVDIDGAVVKPGVYKLNGDSRINDAVISAGGLTDKADRSKINLAVKLVDGQKVYVPNINETGSSGSGGQVSGVNDTVSSRSVNINTASESELDKLPGVGPVTAGKIINGRPYGSPDELLSKKIVNKSTFEKIKDLVSI